MRAVNVRLYGSKRKTSQNRPRNVHPVHFFVDTCLPFIYDVSIDRDGGFGASTLDRVMGADNAPTLNATR